MLKEFTLNNCIRIIIVSILEKTQFRYYQDEPMYVERGRKLNVMIMAYIIEYILLDSNSQTVQKHLAPLLVQCCFARQCGFSN